MKISKLQCGLEKKVFSMSFKENSHQQVSFADNFSGLTAWKQKVLKNPRQKSLPMKYFFSSMKSIFVLYSDKASRPNIPVNVIVSVFIIKELFDYSDNEMVENLMLDFRIQYALHTTNFEKQPLSDKTLNRFSKRCYDYETVHSKDSMMGKSRIRKLSQMKLIYTCIAKLAICANLIIMI